MSNKIDNTRKVTFKEDYKPGNAVIYKKDSVHYIHKDTVALLNEGKLAKFTAEEVDEKKLNAEAKAAFEKAKKAEKE